MADQSLYDQLGGRDGITAVVHRLYELIAADESINYYFDESGMPVESMIEFLVAASGGPKNPDYTMPDLAAAHKKHHISGEAFGKVGGYLSQAMQEFNVPAETAQTVMNLVVGAKDQVVDEPQQAV